MKTLISLFVLWLVVAGVVSAADLVMRSSCDRGGLRLDGDRDACWSEPPNWDDYGGTSEVIHEYGLVTEVANDFIFDFEERIKLARWWGRGMG